MNRTVIVPESYQIPSAGSESWDRFIETIKKKGITDVKYVIEYNSRGNRIYFYKGVVPVATGRINDYVNFFQDGKVTITKSLQEASAAI